MSSTLPQAFLQRLQTILPADLYDTCLRTFDMERPTCFRINPLRGEEAVVRRELEQAGFDLRPISWAPAAYRVEGGQRRALTESSAFAEGRLYIQNPSSMLAPLVLDPVPGETVLDLAAAPGGKTLQMAAMMQNRGRISAVEPVKGRFFRLQANLQRHGVTMVRSYRMDGRAVGRKVPGRFDRVLLDAPCSSEARFRTADPASWAHWSPKKVKESARKQGRLLESAFHSLKPGGRLLYCTCSFAPEENEQVVDGLLRRHGTELRLEPVRLPVDNWIPGLTRWQGRRWDPALARAVRGIPDGEMDGFFLCLLRRRPVAAPDLDGGQSSAPFP